jgi:5-methylcytosine-specific restriction endonuclease McrA
MSYLCRCGESLERGQKCKQCYRYKTPQGNTGERGYDRRWREMSERIRREQPLCQHCLHRGISRPSRECHHILPIATHPELRLVRSNIVALCTQCHQAEERAKYATHTDQ